MNRIYRFVQWYYSENQQPSNHQVFRMELRMVRLDSRRWLLPRQFVLVLMGNRECQMYFQLGHIRDR